MEYKEFEKEFLVELDKNNIKNVTNSEKFYKYMKLLLEWNEKINLTAIKDEKEFIVKHFIDSLTIEKYITNGEKVLHIGTGAGFPGIPIKITKNKSHVDLVDSVNKKLNVIRDIIPKIKLEINPLLLRKATISIAFGYRFSPIGVKHIRIAQLNAPNKFSNQVTISFFGLIL